MRLIRAADLAAKPWKNGGGITYDVAVFPESSGLDAFEWRISMAKVDTDGPFSAFPGIDRTLTLIEGAGMILDVEGGEVALAPAEPFAFSGDARVDARLTAGGILDLNVMTRRGRFTHSVRAMRGQLVLPASRAIRFAAALASLRATSAGVSLEAGPRDCVALGPQPVDLFGEAALIIEIAPA